MEIYTIYQATNKVNQKIYIGFTAHWPQRINGHNYDRRYGNSNKAFYNAIKKYGWDAFEWRAIYQSQDYEHTLTVMEPHFINEYRSWVGFEDCKGYNTTQGGEGTKGWKRSTELVESHRQQIKGRKQSLEHIQKRVASMMEHPNFGKAWLGKKHSPESLEKMSSAQIGKTKSEFHKAAMRLRPQDTKLLTCPHCGKIGDYKNMNRWHMDRCKNNSSRKTDLEKMVTCDVCKHTAPQTPNFYKHHNVNCKSKRVDTQ
jgi:group I intron endonuclease